MTHVLSDREICLFKCSFLSSKDLDFQPEIIIFDFYTFLWLLNVDFILFYFKF